MINENGQSLFRKFVDYGIGAVAVTAVATGISVNKASADLAQAHLSCSQVDAETITERIVPVLEAINTQKEIDITTEPIGSIDGKSVSYDRIQITRSLLDLGPLNSTYLGNFLVTTTRHDSTITCTETNGSQTQ